MTDAEHAELVKLEQSGKLLVGIDRVAARRLFTDVSVSRIAEETGYAPYLEKWIVELLFVLAPLALIGSFMTAFIGFGWWGTMTLAVYPLLYFPYQGASCLGGARSHGITALLVVVIGVYAFNLPSNLASSLALFVFALWCARMVYVTATFFYRAMALRSARLFNFLSEGIEIRRAV